MTGHSSKNRGGGYSIQACFKEKRLGAKGSQPPNLP